LILEFEIALTALSGLMVAGITPVLYRLFKTTSLDDVTPEWLESFSVDRYRPMAGLLSNEDFAFLSRQPGFDPSLYKKLRRERLSIFNQYLRRLILDFNKLHVTARFLVARSSIDQSELAAKLIRLQWAFRVDVLKVQLRFLLCRIGVGAVQVQAVIVRLEQMSDQLSALSLPQAA
jgi:hypothetical protein